jgi:RND superfamily putative drug exporter
MFSFLGRLICHYPKLILLSAALLVGGAAFYSLDAMHHLVLAPGWDVPGSGSAIAEAKIRAQTGSDETPVIVLFRAREGEGEAGQVTDPAFRAAAEAALGQVATNPDVRRVTSYFSTGDARFNARDGRSSYALVQLAKGKDEGLAAYHRLKDALHSETLVIQLGGELPVYAETREQLERDLRKAEVYSFLLLAILLIWVFGSLVAAALPLLVGAASMVMSLALLKVAAQFTEVTVYAANVVSMLGLGLAIDYSLFIVSRYREEMVRRGELTMSLCTTLMTAGRTVAYSGLTVAVSLFCLILLPQRFFQNMGLAGGLSVAAAMMTSVLMLPAILHLLGPRINKFALPVLQRRIGSDEGGSWWYAFSHFVMRNARIVLLGTLLLLLLLGLPTQGMKLGLPDARALPASAESRQVQEVMRAQFAAADLSPLMIAVRGEGKVTQPQVLAGLYALTRQIEAMPGVIRVSGLASLDAGLGLADYEMLYQFPAQFPVAAAALAEFDRGEETRLMVFYSWLPQSEEAQALVRSVRSFEPPAGIAEFHVAGYPAFHRDYMDSLHKWVPITVAAIVGVIFVLLFLMLGSLLVPLKVVLTTLLSLSATYGVLVLIFQHGYFADFLRFTPTGAMDGTVLVLIFASAFGLSIDYEMFLLSRVKEVCDATQDTLMAVSTGIQRSGPIITNAALLIGIVLGAFALSEVVFMKQIGLGLLIAVSIDATIVRMLMVPSSMRLLGDMNWWAPRPLRVLHERFNLAEHRSPDKDKP